MSHSLFPDTAAILAGGLGTRLRSVVADRPKVLASVRGRPFITFLLDQLQAAGIRRVVLLTGYRAEQIRASLGDVYNGINLTYSVEERPLGTAGALRHALPHIANPTLLLLNGDSHCDVDLSGFHAFHEKVAADVSQVVWRAPDASRFGTVVFDDNQRVQGFTEKQPGQRAAWVNAGIYLIQRPLVENIPANETVSLERELFPAWASQQRFYAYPANSQGLDIGTPQSLAAAQADRALGSWAA